MVHARTAWEPDWGVQEPNRLNSPLDRQCATNAGANAVQVNGGSQSFNAVNSLRILGRWMRMFCIPNQSSLPRAYTQFTDEGDESSRLLPNGNRDRLVGCMEEFVKYTIVMRPHFKLFGDRYSERAERRVKEAKAVMATEMATEKADGAQNDEMGKAGIQVDVVNGVNAAGI